MVEAVARQEVLRLVEHEDAQLVEVLPAEEYEWSHLAGAVNIPLKDLDAESAGRLDPARPVIVYCNDFQ